MASDGFLNDRDGSASVSADADRASCLEPPPGDRDAHERDSLPERSEERRSEAARRGSRPDLSPGSLESSGPGEFNQLAAELKPHLPVGVQLVGSTGQIPNVKILAAGLSKDFWAIAADYEPGGATGGGDYSTAALLAYFGQVASICRAAGFQAIAYPTGHPIRIRQRSRGIMERLRSSSMGSGSRRRSTRSTRSRPRRSGDMP